jgi:methionine-gamma-lyase|nr:MAG: L-methionine gamma-lyase [Bacteroidota bacterium]
MASRKRYQVPSQLIHGKFHSKAWDYSHHVVPPISTSTTFRLDSTYRGAEGFQHFAREEHLREKPIYIYDRLGEPNKELLEEHLAIAEGGETAVTFATGMAAISAILGVLLQQGQHIVAHKTLYGCTHSLLYNWLPRYGIRATPVDLTDPEALEANLLPQTRVVYFETPVNPTLELIDIRAVSEQVKRHNSRRPPEERIYVVVDNTFATPYCQRPLELGADFVVHSLTKNIGGFGTDMGGAVICPWSFRDDLLLYRKDFGGALSPRSAWSILAYGLPSLAVRVERQQETARIVAEYLSQHPRVARVVYPGLPTFPQYELAQRQMRDYRNRFAPGTILFFELAGNSPEERQLLASAFMNHIARHAYTITLAVSLGNVRTLIEHPSSMTHAAIPPEVQESIGIPAGGIRLSIGLEEPEDLIRDLEAALEAIPESVIS